MRLRPLPSVLIALVLTTTFVVASAQSATAKSDQTVSVALAAYEAQLGPLVSVTGDLQDAHRSRLEAIDRVASESATLDSARHRLEEDRSRFSALAVYAYMDRGARRDEAVAGSQQGVALASSRLRSDEREVRNAQSALSEFLEKERDAAGVEQRAQEKVDKFEEQTGDELAALGESLKERAPTLPGSAYSAYLRASAFLNQSDPACDVPAALFVGIGRIMSNHGRAAGSKLSTAGVASEQLIGLTGVPTADHDNGLVDQSLTADSRVGPLQVLPAHWLEFAPVDVIESSPGWLYSSAIVAGRVLCSTQADLRTNDGLHRALTSFTGNSALTEAILGSSRQIARGTDIGLGAIPADPRVLSAFEHLETSEFDSGSAEGSRAALLAWSQGRIGTPYSQCLGADARPEDPECPPGTNRFGNGFFDCSGFVSAAYASIGIALPTTTDAMLFDSAFNDLKVGDEFDAENNQAGDVLLMDGHVALSLGDGSIIHASGRQLTEEPMPAWVGNGILGVYRPLR